MPSAHGRDLRLTRADSDHLGAARTVWRTNYGLELLIRDMPASHEIDAAVAAASARWPRMRSRVQGHRWVPGPPARARAVEDPQALRTVMVDTAFDPAVDAPVRVVTCGHRLLLVGMHGATDTPGLVGFSADVLASLAGRPLPVDSTRPVHPLRERAAWRPEVLRAVCALRSTPPRHVTPFPASGPAVAESAAAVWSLTAGETRSVLDAVGETGPAAVVAEVILARCLRGAPPGRWATLFVPVNLRPPTDRWRPVGNHIGHLLIHHDTAVSAAELADEIRAARGPARYAAPWERFIGDLRRTITGRERALPDAPGTDEPVISANVNNLGRLDQDLLPGVEELVFAGSNSPLYPVVTIQSVAERMTICARVRLHQGGQDVADELIGSIRARLAAGH